MSKNRRRKTTTRTVYRISPPGTGYYEVHGEHKVRWPTRTTGGTSGVVEGTLTRRELRAARQRRARLDGSSTGRSHLQRVMLYC